MYLRIIGTGSSVPFKKVTNDDLSRIVETSDEWIQTRTGIRTRHVAENETTSYLAACAANKALDNAGISAEEIDMIIVATSSSDCAFPNTASMVQKQIGAINAACFDVSAACTGFIYAFHIAQAFIQTGMHQRILIIGAEVMSKQIDWSDRSVCVLFGDGAGAAIVAATKEQGLSITDIHTDGSNHEVLVCGIPRESDMSRSGYIAMNGQEVFRFAVKKVPESMKEVLKQAGKSVEDIKYFILHQANVRIIESIAKRLGIPIDKFPMNLQNYGNTSAASIPILLDEMNREHKLKKGDLIMMSGFGAGLSWGSTLLQW